MQSVFLLVMCLLGAGSFSVQPEQPKPDVTSFWKWAVERSATVDENKGALKTLSTKREGLDFAKVESSSRPRNSQVQLAWLSNTEETTKVDAVMRETPKETREHIQQCMMIVVSRERALKANVDRVKNEERPAESDVKKVEVALRDYVAGLWGLCTWGHEAMTARPSYEVEIKTVDPRDNNAECTGYTVKYVLWAFRDDPKAQRRAFGDPSSPTKEKMGHGEWGMRTERNEGKLVGEEKLVPVGNGKNNAASLFIPAQDQGNKCKK